MTISMTIFLTRFAERMKAQGIDVSNNQDIRDWLEELIEIDLRKMEKKK